MTSTRDRIIDETIKLLAAEGADGTSMRRLADKVGVRQPVIYYYFDNKEKLMRAAVQMIGQRLAEARKALPPTEDVHQFLQQRIVHHLRQAPLVMALLNHFLMDKRTHTGRRVPPQAYRHIQEVIDRGVAEGIYTSSDTARDAAIIVHALNGFAMEHFPHIASTADQQLVDDIASFIERALRS